jgi:predicted adenine nucleotide alpha hydrolase (AANH) superfamily ATPase
LAEEEKAHPANYRGCRYAKEEMHKRKSQRTPKTTTRRVFSSNLTTPGVSFVVALQGSIEQQQWPHTCQVAVAGPVTMEPRVPAPLHQYKQQAIGQSVEAPNVYSLPLEYMLRILTAVQQFMTEFNVAVSEGEKIVDIAKTVLNLMKQNGY